MTRTVIAAAVLVGGVTLSTALAQQAPTPPPAAPQAGQGRGAAPPDGAQHGRGGRGGGGGGGSDPGQSNEAAGVAIDRFMGYPTDNPAHFSHGGLITRAILSAGDPNAVGPKGAVLEYRKQVAVATLAPRNSTPLMALPDQYLFYVTAGTGRLEDGKQFWDLRHNIAVLIPPNVQRRFVNASDEPLTMVMLQWEPSAPARADILVRDVDRLGFCEENAHWGNMSKCIFRGPDGLLGNERMYLVMLQPFTWSAPHTHGPGTEEVWVKLTPGDGIALLGSQMRDMPQYAAYLAPPTGFTTHGQINTAKDRVEGWLYIARGPAGGGRGGAPAPAAAPTPANPSAAPPAAAAAPNQGRGGRGNPNLFTDAATIDQATVKGRPIR